MSILLHTLRIKSLMTGLAAGGRFVEVVDTSERAKERQLTVTTWRPAYIE